MTEERKLPPNPKETRREELREKGGPVKKRFPSRGGFGTLRAIDRTRLIAIIALAAFLLLTGKIAGCARIDSVDNLGNRPSVMYYEQENRDAMRTAVGAGYVEKVSISLGLVLLGLFAVLLFRSANERLVKSGVTPPEKMMLAIIIFLGGLLSLMQYYALSFAVELEAWKSFFDTAHRSPLEMVAPFLWIAYPLSFLLFLISAGFFYRGIMASAREHRVLAPKFAGDILRICFYVACPTLVCGVLAADINNAIFSYDRYNEGAQASLIFFDSILLCIIPFIVVRAFRSVTAIPESMNVSLPESEKRTARKPD
ncbi:MAG: hypothetical protein ACYS8W_17500 [Planctomycetota bacterium]|jgi:hypothetical protein